MGRRPGSKDLKKRKERKDIKYKYRKKKCKDGKSKFVPYFSKREKTDPVKIWYWKLEEMSKEGRLRFPKKLQPKLSETIFKKSIRADVDPSYLSNKREVEKLSLEILGADGVYYIMMFCKRKNQWGVSPVKVCSIEITQGKEGLRCRFLENFKLFRYWFWKEGR